MASILRAFSLSSRSFSDKLKISFCLMSIVPLLACFYLVSNYVFLRIGVKIDIASVLLISMGISLVGFLVIKEVFDRLLTENGTLLRRVEKLEIKDALTGLYNLAFIQNRLEEEIKRAITYQRPCAYIIFDIDNFERFSQKLGPVSPESTLQRIGSVIRSSVSETDRVARVGDDEFAIVLPERNKRQAQEMAEEIRKKIEFIYSEEADMNKKITVTAAVSENPLDGITALELMSAARRALNTAKKQGKNRIAGFRE